jgi:hypothetical protein
VRRRADSKDCESDIVSYIQIFQGAAVMIVVVTLFSLRRAHIRVEYSLSWLGVGMVLLACALFPGLLVRIAASLGLNPQVGFVFLAGALALALLFEVSLVVSRLRDENVILTQRLAILEYHLLQIQSDHGIETK